MTWTNEKPKVPGWYWWRSKADAPYIVHLGMVRREIYGPLVLCSDYCEDGETPDELGGHWAGPLLPPEEVGR